jgi:hypothetical protein
MRAMLIICCALLTMSLVHSAEAASAPSRAAHPRRSAPASPAPPDRELWRGDLTFDFDDGTHFDRSDQRSWLVMPRPADVPAPPATLSALDQAVADGLRFSLGRAMVRGRQGSYTVIASSPVKQIKLYEPERLAPEVQHATDVQVFADDGRLVDQLGPFDRGTGLLAVEATPALDWVLFSTMFDGTLAFELDAAGHATLLLHVRPRYPTLPACDVRDLDGDGVSEVLIPAGSDWTFLSRDSQGPCYVDSPQLRRTSTDQPLTRRQRIVPSQLTSGIFVISYLTLEDAAPEHQHDAWVGYYSAERWQWTLSCAGLAARANAQQQAQLAAAPQAP